jgi:hypothetical protein
MQPPLNTISEVIRANLQTLRKPGVISVRPGCRFVGEKLTDEGVIVVTVAKDVLPEMRRILPAAIDSIPLDLREATPLQQLRADKPELYAALAAGPREENRLPEFEGEIFLSPEHPAVAEALRVAFAARAKKQKVPYTPAPDVTLDAVEEEVTLTLHASPDAGWAELKNFLSGIEEELVVGIYDFTSAHILDALKNDLPGESRLTITFDHPPLNGGADQSDERTVEALEDTLGTRFDSAWALTNSSTKAPVWIYPNAYHIKVAVKDQKAFWLSSGNWNNSNQPVIDLEDIPAARAIARRSDRDWHIICQGGSLPKVFRAFLLHDFAVANQAETAPHLAPALAEALVGPAPLDVDEALAMVAPVALAAHPAKFFGPKTVQGKFKIQPLLTPDNYQRHVLDLINSATATFYMQTQYIHPSDAAADADHKALIQAVKDKVDRGLDVRLITSQYQKENGWREKLQQAGIPDSVLRFQNRVHNKGIVVDSKIVMVSSQNWSADGTLRNRDAGLIIHSAEAAQYFEEIFLNDWGNLHPIQ